ncbi:MAG: PmoA family protein [Armatimonadetes bacterium]|nr:PmoA family protein [Armatimonadota bacterium]
MEKRLTVAAGPHLRLGCPVSAVLPGVREAGAVALIDEATDRAVPAQLEIHETRGAVLTWIENALGKDRTRSYKVVADGQAASSGGLEIVQGGAAKLDIRAGGEHFTSYYYGDVPARPYFYPFIGPEGRQVTRNYPMKDVAGENQDHHHHKSVYIAHGDVNGTDNWSEEPDHGFTAHRSFGTVASGPVCGRFTALNDWLSKDREKILEQSQEIIIYNLPGGERMMDFTIAFHATEGDVTFGDTKEGGILSVRVATPLDVPKGTITNAVGGVNEGETWGKAAHWCDYSGVLDGVAVGITVFDHPAGFRHPTHWHVRNYGLMTANPFAYAAYYNDPARDGSHILKAGQTLTFRYRLLVHAGDVKGGRVRERYHDFANPPAVTVED